MPVNPVAWDEVEDGLWRWVYQSADIDSDRVRVLINRDQGEAKGPAPKATITLLSLVQLSQQMQRFQERIMQQRYTVIANGPGEVGVDFFDGFAQTPQRISIVAGGGDPPAVSAAALLIQLQADLPAGYTASADAGDPASIIIDGSTASPVFASSPADALLLAVTTTMPRLPKIVYVEHQATWRIDFRADSVNGNTWAANAMAKAQLYRRSLADKAMLALGFRPAGTPSAQPFVPTDRSESRAVLDVSWIGYLTGAEATTIMRSAGIRDTAVEPAA